MDDNVQIRIETTEGVELSENLREAINRVVAACEATDDEAEVSGFSRLRIGGVDLVSVPKSPGRESWNDGCWGFSVKEETCGWFQFEGESCVGYSVK